MQSNHFSGRSRKLVQPGAAQAVRASDIPAGVIGLGLMGTSIVSCLLAAGHPVVAVTRSVSKHKGTKHHVLELLKELKREGLLKQDPARLVKRLIISKNFS